MRGVAAARSAGAAPGGFIGWHSKALHPRRTIVRIAASQPGRHPLAALDRATAANARDGAATA